MTTLGQCLNSIKLCESLVLYLETSYDLHKSKTSKSRTQVNCINKCLSARLLKTFTPSSV